MDQNTLLTIFVAIAALALLGQALAMLGLFFVARDLRGKVFASWPQVESILSISKRSVEQLEKHVAKIGETTVSIVDLSKQQLVRVDELLSDASTRAKVQMERAEMVLDDTMTRVQETVNVVQRGVLRPVREVHGVVSGIRATLSHLGRRGRPTVEHATSDEEMFI
jgi:hypothetical protein